MFRTGHLLVAARSSSWRGCLVAVVLMTGGCKRSGGELFLAQADGIYRLDSASGSATRLEAAPLPEEFQTSGRYLLVRAPGEKGSLTLWVHDLTDKKLGRKPKPLRLEAGGRKYKMIDVPHSVSADGQRSLVLEEDADDRQELVLLDLAQEAPRQLTSDKAYIHSLAISPDGKLAAFGSSRAWTPSGSPNPHRQRDDDNDDLFVMPIDGGEVKRLTTSGHVRGVSFSADSRRVHFFRFDHDRWYSVGVDGKDQKPLEVEGKALDRQAIAYYPATRPLFWLEGRGGSRVLHHPEKGKLIEHKSEGWVEAFIRSPDGRSLLLVTQSSIHLLKIEDRMTLNVFKADRKSALHGPPAFSPDSKSVFYLVESLSPAEGEPSFKLMRADLEGVSQQVDFKVGDEPCLLAYRLGIVEDTCSRLNRLRKTREATEVLDKITAAALRQFESARRNPGGRPVQNRFPASVDWTPATPCCTQKERRCQPDRRAWEHPTWKSLGIDLRSPHRYQYRFSSDGIGPSARFCAFARGDLDCNGVFSSFEIRGSIGPDGTPRARGPIIYNQHE